MRRIFDICFSLAIFLVFWPFLLILTLLVYFNLGSPILFRQKRTGLDGREFEVIKFRSMSDAKDSNGNLLPDHERLTAFGRLLRSSSLDELPGFWNVLIGHMSVIGPRPQDSRLMARCTPRQFRRHEVKPGITGWAQVNGRNAISWEQRFELDVWYVENRSFWLDMKIIARTLWVILHRRNISANGHATMPEFEPTSTGTHPAE